MDENKRTHQATIEDFLLMPKWRPTLLVVTVLVLSSLFFFVPYPLTFTTWDVSRTLAFGIFGGLALVIPAKDIHDALQPILQVIGPIAYAITATVIYYGHQRAAPGDSKFYEVCALTLPVLLLALVIDARLFEQAPSHPIFIFLNLTILGGGEGAALVSISSGYGSRGIFSNVAGSMVAAFATIVASAISKIPAQSPNDSINALGKLLLWMKSENSEEDKEPRDE